MRTAMKDDKDTPQTNLYDIVKITMQRPEDDSIKLILLAQL